MSYGDEYREFLRTKRQPVDYLPRILELQHSLFSNNQEESLKIARELEAVAREERIYALEQYLLYVLSRLLYIQGQREMMEFTYDDVLANLVKIQLFNRLGENEYYIAIDDWRSHFDAVLDAAKEVAPEVCMTNECRGWSGQFEPEGLWQETEAILGFTYSKEEAEIDRALRSKWSYYTFFPY